MHFLKLFVLFFFLSITLSAFDENETIDFESLAKEPTWLKLLYFDTQSQQSEVLDNDYFLSKDGKTDPTQELKSTIKAYSEPFLMDPNEHPICRFPARYKWLNQKIHLNNYQTIDPRCTNLTKSFQKTHIDSLSLMFVSGYLGNPASSFGHSFLKLNNTINESNTNLFDLAISYGADVPENENVFAYMYKGLSGKYNARFTDKYFYTQDLVYSSTEFRDIWEYQLALPNDKIEFFQLHLWEILGKKFQYYFLKKNCGYEISKMLEVVLDENLTKNPLFWFAPIESFHTLSENNITTKNIQKINYYPSAQQEIYQLFYGLKKDERDVVSSLVASNMEFEKSRFNSLSEGEKIDVTDFLISYYKYLLVKESENENYKNLKNKALVARFALDVKKEKETLYDSYIRPDQSDKPLMVFMNIHTPYKQQSYASFGFSPYAVQGIGKNNLHGNELIVLKGEFAYINKELLLQRFDLINITSFNQYHIPLLNENQFAWKLKIGLQNLDNKRDDYDSFFEGGLGEAWFLNQKILSYIMLNSSLHTDNRILLTPEIGLRMELSKLNTQINTQQIFDINNNETYNQTIIELNWKIEKDYSLYMHFQNSQEKEVTIGMQKFF